jgi:hypothetical protein
MIKLRGRMQVAFRCGSIKTMDQGKIFETFGLTAR